ncbi:MAG: GAF domain-containing protein [Elusimicrobia bacterium]|nr:GAF domain-containing protein [Elusimicrobiota bacterium]
MDPKDRRIRKLEIILKVAKEMAVQYDLDTLLCHVVEAVRQVAEADRASIFILDREKGEFWSKVAQGAVAIRFPAGSGLAGAAAREKAAINVPDAHADPRYNPEVEKQTGYATRSLLTVPMISTQGDVVGVIQAINRHHIPAFVDEDAELLSALAGSAASAIENATLYEEINRLFEGFIKASVVAIEARDPTTSGHSERVAALTCSLAEIVDGLKSGPFASVGFDAGAMTELRYAALLHDFGKIGVREPVLVKAEKLYPHELRILLARLDFIRRTLEKETLEKKLAAAQAGARPGDLAALDAELATRVVELDGMRAFILACNVPTVLDKTGFERLSDIAGKTYRDFEGDKPYLLPGELKSLSIPRGSLTDQDRSEIESHVTHTFRFLNAIPWTRKLKRVPEIAFMHHEKLDGKGYPRAVPARDIPVQARMMTISDIYDALTATDRPYKKAVPVAKALDILADEAKARKIDPELFRLFVDAKVYEKGRPSGA